MWPGHNFANTHGEDIIKINDFTVDTTKYISIQILSPIEIPHAVKMNSFPSTVLATKNSHQTDHDDIQPVKLWLVDSLMMKSRHQPSLVKADLSHCCHLGGSCQEYTRRKPLDLSDAEGLTCLLLASQSFDCDFISDIYTSIRICILYIHIVIRIHNIHLYCACVLIRTYSGALPDWSAKLDM